MSYPQHTNPGAPQQPYYPQPPKKRKVWPWVLGGFFLAILALFGGCAALIGGAAKEVAENEQARSVAAPVGTEVRDGKFAFTVTRVDPPVHTVGDNPYLRKTAQGEFVLVHIDVTNTGDVAQQYFGSNQKLIDDQGREFANDTAAEINVNDELVAEINPGNKISMVLVFDVPTGTNAAAVEFHDSAFSNGARVALK
ncbi:DUF4352 domain-containing protein [Nocardia caishijiensis]|uniref:Uncharacterized protein DUF4352 n=1 Tax=Nocardia caishijiensis TaxID=184756 RepID=A0ABQ6YKK3_9NOCA|nr:DUF4352 domain-containing protein [Nocardia caishijiensis]KAF0846312.1 uncharacterized protein DUF4352 [Nocardia caishijiensis]